MATFGERFKQLRNEKKLTQEQLADKFFLNKSSISRYEQNKQVPEIDLLQNFANFFNVPIDYLLGRTDTREPPISKYEETYGLSRENALKLEKILTKYEFEFNNTRLSKEDIEDIISYIEFITSKKNKNKQ